MMASREASEFRAELVEARMKAQQVRQAACVFRGVCEVSLFRWAQSRLEGDHVKGGRRSHLLLALVVRRLTTPFRDETPFLLLLIIQQPPAFRFGRSLRFFHAHIYILTPSPSCFAFCGRRRSPRIAIVFWLLSGVLSFIRTSFVYLPRLHRRHTFFFLHIPHSSTM